MFLEFNLLTLLFAPVAAFVVAAIGFSMWDMKLLSPHAKWLDVSQLNRNGL